MIDIKQYLEQTNTVLLTKDAFEYLKERASVPDKVKAEYDPSADLISREKTLTAFADYVGSGMSMDDYDALWNIVAKMPAVTPQPKTGRWIAYEVRLPDRTILNYRCSVCGRKLIGYNTETLSEAPFCHCGAKMVELQEGSDKK